MPDVLNCSQGHSWQRAATESQADADSACPVCGATAVASIPGSMPHAESCAATLDFSPGLPLAPAAGSTVADNPSTPRPEEPCAVVQTVVSSAVAMPMDAPATLVYPNRQG